MESPSANEREGSASTSASLSLDLEQLTLSKTPAKTPPLARYQSPTVTSTNTSRISPSPGHRRPKSSIPSPINSPRPLRRSLSQSQSKTASSPATSQKLKRKTSVNSPALSSPLRRRSADLSRAQPGLVPQTSSLKAPVEEAGPATPASVASNFFARELASHNDATAATDTIVIFHDDCYGHRFSRPKTTKSSLSMIVERPERILASVLGVSAAYVRLGSRHSGTPDAPHFASQPPSNPPFKVRTSSRSVSILSGVVAAVHGKSWMEELHTMCNAAGTKLSLGLKELARPEQQNHASAQPERPTLHEGDLYLCSESLNAFQGAIGGVCDAVDAVFSESTTSPSRAFVAVRPPGHHCSSDFPSGFCWINNVHIGIEYAAQSYGLTHAVILDFDLHHGDGSQDITWERNAKNAAMPKNIPVSKKTAIGYYSMHDIRSYPCEWGDKAKVQNASLCIDNAHGQSIWNVHLQPWKTIEEFWSLYETKYLVLLDKARSFLKQHAALVRASPKHPIPKSAIFISAGFDASEWEGQGMQRHAVNVPTEFYARFTRDVVKLAQEEGTGANGRVISVLEGGYSDRALTSGVLSHLSGLCQQTSARHPVAEDQLVSALQGMDIATQTQESVQTTVKSSSSVPEYNIDWWHIGNLGALENYVSPPPPAAVSKRSGRTMLPTYATPTETFTQKVVDPIRFQRTVSGTMRPAPVLPQPPISQDAPEVDWIVATHELSKLLIPTNRQTKSCKAEELAAPRAKKERQSGPPALPSDPAAGGRQLRGRKSKAHDSVSPPTEATTSTEENRRQTISDLPVTSAPTAEPIPIQAPIAIPKRTTRRSSALFNSSSATNGALAPLAAHVEADTTSETATTPNGVFVTETNQPESAISDLPMPDIPIIKAEDLKQLDMDVIPSIEPASNDGASLTTTTKLSTPSRSSSHSSAKSSGPKRIHLKLGTREESERKQKEREEREEAEKQAQITVRPKPRKLGLSKAKLQQAKEMQDLAAQQPIAKTAERTSPAIANLDDAADATDSNEKPTAPPILELQIPPPTDDKIISPPMFTPSFLNEHGGLRTPSFGSSKASSPAPNSAAESKHQGVRSFFPSYASGVKQAASPLTSAPTSAPMPKPGVQRQSSGSKEGKHALPVFDSRSAIPFAVGTKPNAVEGPAYRPAGRTPSPGFDAGAARVETNGMAAAAQRLELPAQAFQHGGARTSGGGSHGFGNGFSKTMLTGPPGSSTGVSPEVEKEGFDLD